jgi:polyhydroxybutyrate depolymerase
MRRLLLILVFVWSIASAAEFTDLDGYQYADSVRYLQKAWVVKGYPDGSYGVDRAMTRAEMMKIVLEGKGWKDKDKEQVTWDCFADVADERYAPYICYASKEKMVKGIGEGLFWPNNNVTIAEGLKIAVNVFGGLGVREGSGDGWYQPFLDRAHNNNILSKYAVYPDAPMTRGQMAYLTHQLMLHQKNERVFDDIRDVIWSAGCGQDKPSSALTEFVVGGVARHAITDIPRSYDPSKPTQLIVAWHGRTNPNSQVREYLDLDIYARNAIVIYPSALPEAWPSRSWNMKTDLAFFDTIIHDISQTYCIDQDQIDIIWHSLGGSWTNWLSCVRGDVIRGMWSVWWWLMTRKVTCSGPVEAMIMHHPDDNLASFAWGQAARDLLLQQNRCDPDSAVPVHDVPSQSHCVQYDCMVDAPVIRCPHIESNTRGYYYPHTWPSFATEMIVDLWKSL